METLAGLSKLFGKTFFCSHFVIIIFSFIILYDRLLHIIAPLTWQQLSQKVLFFTTLMHEHLKTREGARALLFSGLKTCINSQRTCASTVPEFFLEGPGRLSPGSWASQW
jgi:hypothetical protein